MTSKAVLSSLLFSIAGLASVAMASAPKVENARVETVQATGDLGAAVRQAGSGREPAWVSWSVPVVEGQSYTCCWSKAWKPDACRLEKSNQSWGNSSKNPTQDPYLNVLVRIHEGRVERVRSFSETCPLDAGGRRFVRLEGVQPEESVRYLQAVGRTDPSRKTDLPEEVISAVALHRNATAVEVLTDFATSDRYPPDTRENALFWLGQARGRAGYEVVARVLREEKDNDIREKALFALSESPVPEAGETLLSTARTDRSSDVRSEALFWLAQMDHGKAPATILEAIDKDPDPDVREHAVFVLSQLPDGKGIPLLIKVGRENRDREIRKQAVFWLAESDDPQALSFLERMLAN